MNYKSFISLVVVTLLLVSIFTPAAASVVYGSVKFERTDGGPDVVQNNFSLNGINGIYTLYVKNGDGAENLSSSSLIRLNGETVVRTNEFNQNVRLITKNISVQQTNQLEVEMRSIPGSYITLWVEDETSVITILSPWDDTVSNEPIRVSGTVSDSKISNLTLNHNGNISTVPVINGNFSSIVNLTEINNITLSAVDSVSTLRSATLLLDGDMLPESYEQLSGFDPQNPDSDASLTQENEAGNGIKDGYEMLGGQLPSFIKYRIGADPFKEDTDSDGLTDYFELMKLGLLTDIRSVDSDSDGIPDAEEDPDNDGLTNIQEQTYGTDPLVSDSDKDSLSDSFEVNSGTNPLSKDTDSDGLNDDSELRLGTNPLNPDTDGDGILDGDEVYTSVKIGETPGVKASITGKGDLAKELKIYNVTSSIFTNIPALVSPVIDFSLNRTFENAHITLPYNAQKVNNPSNISLFYFNESLGTFVQIESTVDAANHTVTGVTSHFTTFAIFDVPNWNALFVAEMNTGMAGTNIGVAATYTWDTTVPNYNPAAVIHNGTIDTSYLVIGDFLGVSPSQPNAPGYGDSGAIVGWDDSWIGNVGNPNTNGDKLDGLWVQIIYPAEGWWDLGYNASRVAVSLSQDHGPYLAEGLEVRVYGSNDLWGAVSTQAVLKEVYLDGWRLHNPAEDRNRNGWTSDDIAAVFELPGYYRYVKLAAWSPPYAGDLLYEPEVDAVAGIKPSDSDNDGLPDVLETGGFRDGLGNWYFTDPNDADTDGDGLSDGEEAGSLVEVDGKKYFNIISKPTLVDSDYDSIADSDEEEFGTAPLNPDYDKDGLKDGFELEIGTDPLIADTDYDGYDDYEEYYDPDYDPLVYEKRYSLLEIARDVVLGAVLGEWGAEKHDSLYYFAGWMLSGFIVVGDIRDIAASIRHGDGLGALLNALALIPAYGDAAKVAATITKFVAKHPNIAFDVAAFVLKYVYDSIDVIKAAYKNIDDGIVEKLNSKGFSNNVIVVLFKQGIDLPRFERILSNSGIYTDFPGLKNFVADQIAKGELEKRVTFDIKKMTAADAAGRSAAGYLGNLKGAYTEYLASIDIGGSALIGLKHVNKGGVDYAALDGTVLKIVEAKARQSLTLGNLDRYIKPNRVTGALEFNADYVIKDIGEDYLKNENIQKQFILYLNGPESQAIKNSLNLPASLPYEFKDSDDIIRRGTVDIVVMAVNK